ncbi:MAG: hypothetical protein Q9M40_12220 [Sulfurimonas sp.]|nr:hypothetical protein [Sulfurimonas sp.]
MHSIRVEIQDNAFDKVIYFLKNLPKNEVTIVEDKQVSDDWSYLESEIDLGLNSGVSEKSHSQIVNNLKRKYA